MSERPGSTRPLTRRSFLLAAAGLGVWMAVPPMVRGGGFGDEVSSTVRVVTSPDFRFVYFDPVGLWIPPGATVIWRIERGFHSVTAYHPANANHELRIPEAAEPWDSGILTGEPGKNSFRRTFTVPGVYDYFCRPHEAAGMVGRLIVGEPGDGPGTRPFDWGGDRWRSVPDAARVAFPSLKEIMQDRIVRWGEPAV